MKPLSEFIDFTLLQPDASRNQILELCRVAESHSYKAVCVPPYYVALAHEQLRDSSVSVCTVVGFPLGYSNAGSKLAETQQALKEGADEIDMVIHQAAFVNGEYTWVGEEIRTIAAECHQKEKILKVIIESGRWNKIQIQQLCELCLAGMADFVKTSTGFSGLGAELEKVKLIRSLLPENIGVKASGGIKTEASAWEFIQAGASRIGTSSIL